ncbi:ABC transporter ATP-binding protein [Mesorhizobium sp. BR1-1-3]|uniref:ABC transporter ATP-binding protein n=1 Tax=Mesorhizobium sp. BR1-1-3 TaxID=2876651 RepID=UPI001CD1529A|nr:ABC transporter ATP-binding protein [Mesorhizobium sp. BR1-1-3]MBZ9887402.1 ABC transporter ATP-binding protein [Mesorhizobium sp. BR1-1-3]
MKMLLDVERLQIGFGAFSPVDDVTFGIDRGEVLGVVGESGSGKSLSATAIMGLLPRIGARISSGRMRFDGIDLVGLPEKRMRRLRGGKIALITQNPMTSLDPMIRVGPQIDQSSRLHLKVDRKAARARSLALMADMQIPNPAVVYDLYPFQLSGGMKQRIVIAMALAGEPQLLIADEATTALDVTVQAQIIKILVDLVKQRGLALILITHDMGIVAQACDRVAVMYCGRIIESGAVERIFENPRHPYTKALIRCIPRLGMVRGSLSAIPGTVPNAAAYPTGCRFRPRCPVAVVRCQTEIPKLHGDCEGHGTACHLVTAA